MSDPQSFYIILYPSLEVRGEPMHFLFIFAEEKSEKSPARVKTTHVICAGGSQSRSTSDGGGTGKYDIERPRYIERVYNEKGFEWDKNIPPENVVRYSTPPLEAIRDDFFSNKRTRKSVKKEDMTHFFFLFSSFRTPSAANTST